MSKRKWIVLIILTVLVVGILGAINISNNANFWEASIVDLIDIAFAFFIAFYFSDLIVKSRRKKDAIERIILEIRTNINNPDFFSVKPQSTTLQASCGNKIKYLKEDGLPEILGSVTFIEGQLETIMQLHDNHKSNLDEVRDDFVACQLKIMDKCDKIQMSLYKD